MEINALRQAMQTLNVEDAFRPRLNTDQWRSLMGFMTRSEVRPGELLIRQGDRERCMYMLEAGSLQVFVTGGPPAANRIAILRAGSVVGEPSLFYDAQRMANVEAMMPSVIWALPGTRLDELAQRNPIVALEFLRAAGAVMAIRMRSNLTRPTPTPMP